MTRVTILILSLAVMTAAAVRFPSQLFGAMQWRLIGPFRGGRVTAVAGIPGQPNHYYFGTPGGGVWESSNGGTTWRPIFDSQRVASIGAIAVAESDPRTLYVGTGEQTRGDGVYKSTDSGATWSHAGLTDTRFIQAIVVDPKNPKIAIAGANSLGQGILWRPLPKTAFTTERGVYKTTDGGATWAKVLAKDDTIGVVDLCSDPGDARVLYAVVYRPGTGAGKAAVKATSEIYKSADEGSTWEPLKGKGLPEKDRGRVGLVVAPGNHGRRIYAIMDQGFFRTDDAGATWQRSTNDPRIVGSAYFSRIFADTVNPDVLYVAQTSLYRSTDGGHTFEAYVGAPSGDDFHVLWIDKNEPKRMLLGVDQGAIVSVDAGQTWNTWYNQPTGQFYHVSTDSAFPYRVFGAQQDSGTAGVLSRSDYGEITYRDWLPIGGFEYSFITADPLKPDSIYSGGWYGTVVRFDKNTGKLDTVFERSDKYRTASMAPLKFSPQDPHTLYLGTQYVLSTKDGGVNWKTISPDLTGFKEEQTEPKEDADRPAPAAITTLSPSPLAAGQIWVGTSDRLVQLTRDAGASWQNISPAGLSDPQRILSIEASQHDPAAAYVTAGGARESTPPYVARTHDYGHTWQTIVNGLPSGEMARVVREDPARKGLLYAGTDSGVYVSFDDGDNWQSLQLNLPTATVTDLEIHGDDLVASTFGRSLWILDDVTPLREITAGMVDSEVHLFQPAAAIRARWDNNQDTPLPPETPAGKNPPDGAIVDYYVKAAITGDVSLSITDAAGKLVRRFTGTPEKAGSPPPNVPEYWFGAPLALPKRAGLNRFVWDLRYPAPLSLPFGYSGELLEYTEFTLADHAIPGDTPRQQPQGPLVAPGIYTLELVVGGKPLRQQLTVKPDPRVAVSQQDLEEQLALAQRIMRGMSASYREYRSVEALRTSLKAGKGGEAFEKKLDDIDKGKQKTPGFGPINRDLTRLFSSVESGDSRPSTTVREAVEQKCKALDEVMAKWREMNAHELPTPVSIRQAGCSE